MTALTRPPDRSGMPMSHAGDGHGLGGQKPLMVHVEPETPHCAWVTTVHKPLLQQVPVAGGQGLGEHDPPVVHTPEHEASATNVQLPRLQHRPGTAQGLEAQFVPGPRQSPKTNSQAANVFSEHAVPTQHAPVWAKPGTASAHAAHAASTVSQSRRFLPASAGLDRPDHPSEVNISRLLETTKRDEGDHHEVALHARLAPKRTSARSADIKSRKRSRISPDAHNPELNSGRLCPEDLRRAALARLAAV